MGREAPLHLLRPQRSNGMEFSRKSARRARDGAGLSPRPPRATGWSTWSTTSWTSATSTIVSDGARPSRTFPPSFYYDDEGEPDQGSVAAAGAGRRPRHHSRASRASAPRSSSLMKKGVTELQNVRLLKWCAELGIVPNWALMYGFPGEDPIGVPADGPAGAIADAPSAARWRQPGSARSVQPQLR